VVRLIIEGGLDLDLVECVRHAKELVAQQGFTAAGGADPVEFIADRLRYYVRTVHGFREDVIDAIVKPRWSARAVERSIWSICSRV
jgi:Glycyl-tRNA synthetase, beta subunit